MDQEFRPRQTSFMRVLVGLVLLVVPVFVIGPLLGGSRRADRKVYIHDNGSVVTVLQREEWGELLNPESTDERFIVAACFFHHDFRPGILFPLFETRSTSMLMMPSGSPVDEDSMDSYRAVAAAHLMLDRAGRRFRPGQPEEQTIAWVPMILFTTIFMFWWWLSSTIGGWLAHIDLHFREALVHSPRRYRNECERCGYPRGGHVSAVCPECGRDLPKISVA